MVFCLRPRKYPAKGPSRKGSSAPPKKPSEAEIRTWYRVALDKIVSARLEQESNTARGEPIFLSHYISQGQFRHWVLHTYGHKYELRQRQDSNGGYAAKISPSPLDLNILDLGELLAPSWQLLLQHDRLDHAAQGTDRRAQSATLGLFWDIRPAAE
ncbi:LOW QUALITY PROTEIN: 2-hydroxyphytanoyl-CoA lyase [Aspergillus luchuensis]|uniref:2-hydroxyphytanoyl-CoA lyase n=1 Tax=Aspergillus kawachii TaxID=1069201 RepID=A0A146F4T5_ASPKA|nr:LOW QUALITY PROTEIN: 2-hydroxyphytanoyl-CoA lyase [Aspergillus luchuensis]